MRLWPTRQQPVADLTGSGQRCSSIQIRADAGRESPEQLHVVQNFFEELKAKVGR
jgi:hypothetical protein